MQISNVVDQVPTAELERLATVAVDAAVVGADRDALDEAVDTWCLDLDDDTTGVVVATILALGLRAILADRASRTVQVAA